MPTPTAAARYRDAGGHWHDVVVHQTPEGRWHVLDITPQIALVETLTGYDEGRPQAEALARDYAASHHRPLPQPAGDIGFAA